MTNSADSTTLSPKACDTRQLVNDLHAIATTYSDKPELRERLAGAVEQFVAASSVPSDDKERCAQCGWRRTTSDHCAELACPESAIKLPSRMDYRSGHHERYVTGYNDGLNDAGQIMTQGLALLSATVELDEDRVEQRMHEFGLIGVAGDNPKLESCLIDFVKACLVDAAARAQSSQ